ncbi:DUF4178 domain-containing protein [Pseudenhygromyxa sp. WMMC2535]|uniref:DUF4178 domain-containing protein n=1 Tax=Pseudenhygromyxa sp. WMMC2535 TaxID=2712867 RepID=UPI0015532212|nr:DUF4178 domain-containing protein [Pseudenhygromyxa sp. WMMC2535]NVB43363.1 DUF4178 domain-containing protein [Pseudenhygromyxa sp. WMMC2535]
MDQAEQIFCPECGAPIQFRGTTVSAVCEYCDSTVVRTGVDVELIGKVSALIDNGSPILLHAKGRFDGMPFTVDGRLQVGYARGTWNEWLLAFADGTIGWLVDAQGQYAVLRPMDPSAVSGRVPSYQEFILGQEYSLAGRPLVAIDKRGAAYKGAEGELPFEAAPGMQFWGVDLRGYQGEFMTLDWGTDPKHDSPTPYMGRAVSLAELQLFPLRRFQGWAPARPPAAS